jgi:pantoate--beta-alanine ligase
VNPTQFAPHEDFAKYPRTLDADLERAESAGADVVFAPEASVIYPPGRAVAPPPLPEVATRPGLEDRARPTHFAGVCQVVARLFDLVRPTSPVFGEKDFQQLRVIEEMVAAMNLSTGERSGHAPHIVRHPTVREADGLAMSSRNRYLRTEDRAAALGLSRSLAQAVDAARSVRDASRIEERMRAVLVRHRLDIEYAVVRDARTLLRIESIDEARPWRALIAAQVGSVRLIDNAGPDV